MSDNDMVTREEAQGVINDWNNRREGTCEFDFRLARTIIALTLERDDLRTRADKLQDLLTQVRCNYRFWRTRAEKLRLAREALRKCEFYACTGMTQASFDAIKRIALEALAATGA